MAYHIEKDTGDLVFDGFENGISPSPHKGIANMQCVNTSTESGEVLVSYARVQQSQIPITGQALTVQSTNSLLNTNTGPSQQLKNGDWITISGSSGTPANGSYYVFNCSGTTAQVFQIANTFGGPALTGFTGSIGTFFTINMSQPVISDSNSVTEKYFDSNHTQQYRYYILDITGKVWMHDTANATFLWALIDNTGIANSSGIGIYQGWLFVIADNSIYYKQTVQLGVNGYASSFNPGWATMTSALNSFVNSNNPHYILVGHQATLNYCDGAYLGTIFANSTTTAANANIWAYGLVTADPVTDIFTIATQYGGDVLVNGATMTLTYSPGGVLPTPLAVRTSYFVVNANSVTGTFQLSATVGGGAVNITDAGTGNLFFNTFNPQTAATFVQSFQALTLPKNEISQCLAEISNQIVVGCKSNTLYLWDQVNPQAQGFIPLPENNTIYLLSVNNMAYAFAGTKGNIYITNGSTASLVTSAPDYITQSVEPYYAWGGAAYIRGRVYFSISDNNSKTGGIWSFIPTQNFFIGQDFGIGLRIDAQNSYGTYAGKAMVILNSQDQSAQGAQYWSAWYDGSSTYGIDFSSTSPYIGGQAVIETDAVPIGTFLNKKTEANLEFKLSQPLAAGESVQLKWRTNIGFPVVYTSPQGSVNWENENKLSGYFTVNFQAAQWLQLQAILTSTASSPSYVRLLEIRVR